MKRDSVILGSILIFLGGFWLLNNLGLISISIIDVFKQLKNVVDLWPLALILLGVHWVSSSRAVRSVSWILMLGIVVAYIMLKNNYITNFI
ncbi:hypothetical protein CLPU_3c03000 [Gottschalkia purinilytica]|uniref:LiaI-LiaF-like transmembrane region domain-containing protein n=1 Tax=Gottschalkia purinilytica TaxID=1503 RepID=A0A0L0WDM9_GOTPU|nr:DUF5668 domain-containing protein [Gottschalkia purinilytica]KNF09520.1 hypothetical protein CLPU_3c03000 [Gottschalkia purinilytica]